MKVFRLCLKDLKRLQKAFQIVMLDRRLNCSPLKRIFGCIFVEMDFAFENRWQKLLQRLESQFGANLDIEGILFLIGVQELGDGSRKFVKDEKINLIHIAICTILEPLGYYQFSHLDEDRWPHFKVLKKLPNLNDAQQKQLMREAILLYFENTQILTQEQKSFD